MFSSVPMRRVRSSLAAVMLVMTLAAADEAMAARKVYNLKGIVGGAADYDVLHQVITETIEPDGWEDVGGEGQLDIARNGMTVINTLKVQKQVGALLDTLRDLPTPRAGFTKPLKVTKIEVVKAVRAQDDDAAEEPAGFALVVYPVADLLDSGANNARDFPGILELFMSTIAPETWDEVGGSGAVKEFDHKVVLVVRQTPRVHRQIENLLTALRAQPRIGRRRAARPAIEVATWKKDGKEFAIVVYPVADLLSGPLDFDAIMTHVTDKVQPKTWYAAGGPGPMMEYISRGVIVLSSSAKVHQEVAAELTQLRRRKK